MKIICIGNASYDLTVPYDGFPIENTKNRVTEIVEGGGGPASNAAYLLGKWGMDTTFIGGVGKDDFGKRIIEELQSVGVNTEYIEFDDDAKTTLSIVIVNKNNGSRTTIAHRDSNMGLVNSYKDIKADVILVDGQELRASLEVMENNPNAITIIDAGRVKEEVITLAKKVKYLVCSKNFAEEFTNVKIDLNNPKSISDVYSIMLKEFKNNIIITLESEGCLYMHDNKIKLMPSIKVKAVDTTGAGDFFHGAFTYCMAQNFDIETSLKISNITGGLSVTKMGARNSVFPLEEVMKKYEENA
ncbi:MAG TPA: carbohydrate kinase family protein [Mollicutes bacterium]|nr:carbohydrate kinase family protein [Mollicutes bacterium]